MLMMMGVMTGTREKGDDQKSCTREKVKNKQGDGKSRAGRRETVKMSREKGNGFQAGRFFGKNEQGDGKFRAGRREMRENEQGEGR